MITVAAKIEIARWRWFKLARELHRRGRDERESGAFLLAREATSKVVRSVYYDDLDPRCMERGYIHFDGAGYVKLWQICQQKGLRVVADVHTHPTKWTGQSESDAQHPMIPQKGHMALIIPNFARGLRFTLRGVGVYEYLGDGEWRQWTARSGIVRVVDL